MTQVDLAKTLSISRAAVSRRMCGEVPFSVTDIHIIASWLKVSPSDLIGASVDQSS